MSLGLLAALAGALLVATPVQKPEATPREAFDRGRTAFGRAEYARAIEILRPLLYPEMRLDSEGEVVQAHRMLGVAHLFENQPEEAKREFRKLLELRPDYRFDPLLDPPRVVDFFNVVRKEEEDGDRGPRAARKKRDAEVAARQAARGRPHPPATRSCTYEQHSYASTSSRSARASSRTGSGEGVGVPGRRGGAGRRLAGRVLDQLRALRRQPPAPLPASAEAVTLPASLRAGQ